MSTSEMQATPQDDTSATSEELDEIRDLIGKIMLWGFNITGLRRPTEILLAGAMISELRAIKAAAITADRQQRDAQHAAEVAQIRQTAQYFHKHQDALIAFIAEREIEQFATSNAYLCHPCGRYDHRPEDIKHADDCPVARFLAWRAMDKGESNA